MYAALPQKIVAVALIAVFVVLGVIGLVLPLCPGVLFLAIAAWLAMKNFPSLGERLKRHPALGPHLHLIDRAAGLSLARKVELAGWLCAKAAVRAAQIAASLAARLATTLRR